MRKLLAMLVLYGALLAGVGGCVYVGEEEPPVQAEDVRVEVQDNRPTVDVQPERSPG